MQRASARSALKKTMTKILFFGTSDYCLPIVESLQKNFDLIGIITKSSPNPVKIFAEKNNIQIFAPSNLKELLNLNPNLTSLNPNLAVVADYGLIIPEKIFTIPEHKTINIHFSKLPKYRGPSPVQYSILFGEKSACVSIIKMAEKVDTGNIIWQKEYSTLSPLKETTGSLYRKLFENIAKDLPQVINNYTEGKLIPKKQTGDSISYSQKLSRDDGFIPFKLFHQALQGQPLQKLLQQSILYQAIEKSSSLAKTIEHTIRAFDPWPGVWTILPSNKRLKILKASLEDEKLIPELVQLEGKKPVTWKQFLEGYPQIKSQLNF